MFQVHALPAEPFRHLFELSDTELAQCGAQRARVDDVIERLLLQPGVEYLHLHNANLGCFAARVARAWI